MKQKILLLFILFFAFQLNGQHKPERIVILGSASVSSCDFEADSNFVFINSSVPDFSSGQLFWTLEHGVLINDPGYCIIQTGSVDILMGIPAERIMENIIAFYTLLKQYNVKLIMVEDFPLWNDRLLSEEMSIVIEKLHTYCNNNDIPFITLNDLKITDLNQEKIGVSSVSSRNCKKVQAGIINHLRK